MAQTNGKTPAPGRDEIIRAMTYHAAIAGYYDTSEEAQQSELLTISVIDEAALETLPPDITHKFYVLINSTAYHVARTSAGAYSVTPDMDRQPSAQEHELREHVLEAALAHYGYPGQYESKAAMLAAMLEDEADEGAHPVITELADEGGELPEGWIRALRSWDVTIGDANCVVGMFPGGDEDSVYFTVVFS